MTVVTKEIESLKADAQHSLVSAKKIMDKADRENRRMTGEEHQQVERAMAEHDKFMEEAKLRERVAGMDPSTRLFNESVETAEAEEYEALPQDTRDSGRREDREDVQEDDGIDPFNMRWDGRDTGRGFRDMSVVQERSYLMAARTRDYNASFYSYLRNRDFEPEQELALKMMMRTMTEGVDADGGYLAPTQLVAGIQREEFAYEQLKPRMDVIRSNARSLTYTKGLDAIVAGWVAELGTKPEDQVTFGRTVLVPNVGAVVIWVSDELLEDESFGLQGYLSTLVAEAKVLLEEEAFISGSGSGRPFGILTRLNAEGGTPNRYTTQVANTISANDIIRIPYLMPPQYRRRGVYILGTNAIRTIRLQRDDSGASAGTGGYIWQQSLQAGEPDMLNGYPVVETSAVALNSAVATGNDIGIFGDLRRYRVFERLGLQVKRLEELRALTDEVGFRFRFRTGGDVMYNPAFRTIRVL